MGYDLHITRKRQWSDEAGLLITESEWRNVITRDPELSLDCETSCEGSIFAAWNSKPGALAHHDGEISAKNPEKLLIGKMVRIARQLGADVQCDDGEVYREDGSSFYPESDVSQGRRTGVLTRITAWFGRRQPTQRLQNIPAFSVGQRVKNVWGDLGTVTGVDRNAHGGLGSLRIRLDDGREQHLAYVASGLEIVGDAASPPNGA
jgi:hypothetical protein